MTTLFTENFDNFLGQGFTPTPTARQLDSDIWRATGFSDFTGAFGGTFTSGDSARGANANGGVSTGGIYAFTTSGNTFLGVQPGGNDFTPGTITLKLTNTTGAILTDLTVNYDIFFNNDQPRANSLNFAYSLDDNTYTPVSALDFTTPGPADAEGFVSVDRTTNITGLNIANNDNFFLQWQGGDVSGSGSRDEYGIDNIEVINASAPSTGTMNIKITEFIYTGGDDEFVEFTNLGTIPVNMNGWSYSDDNRTAGTFDLSGFGVIQPGESVILAQLSEADFRGAWSFPNSVKVVGSLDVSNLGRNDEINLFDQDGDLVDRLTYGDQNFSGTIRTRNASGWAFESALGSDQIDSNWVLSTVGDAQNSFTSVNGDIASPGIYTRAEANTASDPTITIDLNSTTPFLTGNTLNLLPATGGGALSGVINDSTDPAQQFGIDFLLDDPDTAIGDLTVTVSSSDTDIVPNGNLNLTGSGNMRNLTITPAGVGFTNITVTVSDGDNTDSYLLRYGASGASVNPDTTRFLTGASDASTAIAIDSDFMLVADDEDQVIRLYSRTQSGAPLNGFDFSSSLGLTDLSGGVPREVDIEASSKLGNTIYWMGSHGNNSSGNLRPNRSRIFATTLNGSGENTTLGFAGFYEFLRDDFIAWDNNNGHGLGAGFLGLENSASQGIAPEDPSLGGLNIEGLTFAPDNSTAYISFRAPNLPTTARQDALIVPVTNFTNLLGQNSGSATFDAPIFLDLGGRGIRSIERNNTGEYLIVAGPADEATGTAPKDFRLYTWDGNAQNDPILKDADLTALNSGGSFESIVEVPDNLSDADVIPLLVDNGDTVWYDNNTAAKILPDDSHKKFRQEFVQLGTVITKIHEIQGNADTQISNTIGSTTRTDASPLLGETVTIEGVVVADFQLMNQLRGFFIQEEDFDQDNDPTTSEGLFVFTGDNPVVDVEEGQIIRVTGNVNEFFGMTQITATANGSLNIIDAGNNLNLVTPTIIDLPIDSNVNIDEFYEQYEGMLVQFNNKLVVSEYFQLERFGQITLTADERPFQYTHITDNPTVTGFEEFSAQLERKRIILDDGNNIQNFGVSNSNPDGTIFYPQPDGFGVGTQGEDFFRGGDSITDLTGVLHWSFAGASGTDAWRIRPTENNPIEFTVENPRPLDPPDVGGNVKVGSFNVLNYFNTLSNGSNNARGANSIAEFNRQSDKLVQAIIQLDADVLGLIEIENNGDQAQPAIKELVERLNAELGSNVYGFVDAGKVGTDAITNGFIYKTSTMEMLGNPAILNDASFTDPNGTGQQRSRPAIAQTFRVIDSNNDDFGESFNVVVNHFKSKGASSVPSTSPDADQGDGQGNWNDTRTKAAQALATWIDNDPTGSGDSDYLIIGDLNAYKGETPITALKDAGYTDLLEQFSGNDAYSFVFNGQLGYLDHALGNASVTDQVTGVAEWLINSDEVSLFDYNDTVRDQGEQAFNVKPSGNELFEVNPFRTSDHDPLLVGLNLNQLVRQTGGAGNDVLTGPSGQDNFLDGGGGRNIIMAGDGNDILIGGQGPDRLTGGGGNNIFRYDSLVDIGDTITDFTPGTDKIDLSRVLLGIGYSGNDPLGDGVVINNDFRGNTILQIDPDGSGPARAFSFIRLQGVSASAMNDPANFIF